MKLTPEQRPEVVQVDREAAARNILARLIYAHGYEQPWMDASTTALRMGEQDDHYEVQAFARHRIAAEKAALERAAQIADIHAEATDTPDDFTHGYENASRRIARAIRRASHPERRSENG